MDSELLYVFGTGNATVTNLYNTCFALRDGDEYFMVDAGGGNGILKILDNMQVPLERIRDPRPHRPCTRHRLDDPHDRNKDEKGPVYRGRPHLLSRRVDRDDQNTLPPDDPG